MKPQKATKTHKTREKLISAANELFLSRGYQQTSLLMIANRCEISKPTIYHYFNSRETLVANVVQAIYEECWQSLFGIPFTSELDFQACLEAYIEQFDKLLSDDNKIGLINRFLYEIGDSIPQAKKYVELFYRDWLASLKFFLEKKFSIEQANEYAEEIICYILGALTLRHNDPRYTKMKSGLLRFKTLMA